MSTAAAVYALALAAIEATLVDKVSVGDILVHHPLVTEETPVKDRYFSLRARKLQIKTEERKTCEERILECELIIRYTISETYQTRMLEDADALVSTIRDLPDGADILRVDEFDVDMDDLNKAAFHMRLFNLIYRPD